MSCGPVNSLQKLTNHSQVDRSLHQDHQQRKDSRQQQFRQIQENHHLDREFQQQFSPIFQNAFQSPHNLLPQLTRQHQAVQPIQAPPDTQSWANDFAKLSITHRHHHQQQQLHPQQIQPLQDDWSSQFINQIPLQHQVPRSTVSPMEYPNQLRYNNTNAMMIQPHTQQSHMTEHKELHHHEHLASELESQFAQLEKELQPVAEQEEESLVTPKNPGFKDAAKEIVNVMRTSKNSKFANSEFLKLMTQVSSGQVELNCNETKLVDEQGKDIHEAKLEDSVFENTQRAPEEEELKDTSNHLPDPLEGLTAADLTSPFAGASRIAELHGEKYSWDDVYVDYKNDDTNF